MQVFDLDIYRKIRENEEKIRENNLIIARLEAELAEEGLKVDENGNLVPLY